MLLVEVKFLPTPYEYRYCDPDDIPISIATVRESAITTHMTRPSTEPKQAPRSATSKIFPFPLNAWYVAAWDHEVTSREPLARTVAGRPLALWRTTDGRVSALADACWHRLAPLSKGKILGEELQCPYHGLRYNRAGRCTSMPAQETVNPSATVPSVLALTLGTAGSFGALTPAVAKDYSATMTATVTSTAADAALTAFDSSATATGHLVNGSFSLPSPLQVKATSAVGTGTGALSDLGGFASPTPLLTYSVPISNDAVTLGFQQHVDANDALRAGTYSKTITFTLSTTTP